MASVNGISLKALKQFRDHEGFGIYQGSLYIGNKKIGYWSQDAWGGPDHVELLEPYAYNKLSNWFDDRGEDLETALWTLLKLKLDEDEWKSMKCDRLFIGSDGYHVCFIQVQDPETTVEDMLRRKDVACYIKDHFFENGDNEFRIVDKDSFDVGTPITIKDIKAE